MPLTPQALIDDVGELVSLPEVVLRINEMVNDEHASAADIGRVISHDPGLTTRLLKIANSPMYGNMRQIDSINRAVTILGTKQIRDIIISTTATKVFAAGSPSSSRKSDPCQSRKGSLRPDSCPC